MALHRWPKLWFLCHPRNQTLHLFLPWPGRNFIVQTWLILQPKKNRTNQQPQKTGKTRISSSILKQHEEEEEVSLSVLYILHLNLFFQCNLQQFISFVTT